MADRDPPADAGTADDTTLSFTQGVEDLTGMLDDQDDNPDPADNDQGPDDADADADTGDEPGPDDAEADAETDENADDPEVVASGGKFVSADAKFKLEDGTVITVAELARNNLFQRDYTRKTEAMKADKQELEAGREQVTGYAQALAARRDFLLQVMPLYAPQPPDDEMLDPNSPKYEPFEHMHLKAQFDKARDTYNQLMHDRQAEQKREQDEAAKQQRDLAKAEAAKLEAAIPDFKDRAKYNAWWAEIGPVMVDKYGFAPEELDKLTDHRMYLAMRDLGKYHKAAARVPQVREQVNGRLPLLKSGQRPEPKSKISREVQGRQQRLAKSGRMNDAVAALLDFDL